MPLHPHNNVKPYVQGHFEALYSAHLARGGEIICIMADISGGNTVRIATGTQDKCIQVWLFDSNTCELKAVHSKADGDNKGIVPKTLAFDANEDQDLYIFGLYDGCL